MDVSNEHLKYLLDRTDVAFQAVMREPECDELHLEYEYAKTELDQYVAVVRQNLTSR
ncbi:hypothetical protein [Alteromonas aestuariivivens]|uniref:hypothetical protein n=1 Tax=Alteromonas aestuariivivens TaxID=1938339 RepID=UPI0015F2669D|nr:hypothetical protein [Alteromonas aestuariivivens]